MVKFRSLSASRTNSSSSPRKFMRGAFARVLSLPVANVGFYSKSTKSVFPTGYFSILDQLYLSLPDFSYAFGILVVSTATPTVDLGCQFPVYSFLYAFPPSNSTTAHYHWKYAADRFLSHGSRSWCPGSELWSKYIIDAG